MTYDFKYLAVLRVSDSHDFFFIHSKHLKTSHILMHGKILKAVFLKAVTYLAKDPQPSYTKQIISIP